MKGTKVHVGYGSTASSGRMSKQWNEEEKRAKKEKGKEASKKAPGACLIAMGGLTKQSQTASRFIEDIATDEEESVDTRMSQVRIST